MPANPRRRRHYRRYDIKQLWVETFLDRMGHGDSVHQASEIADVAIEAFVERFPPPAPELDDDDEETATTAAKPC